MRTHLKPRLRPSSKLLWPAGPRLQAEMITQLASKECTQLRRRRILLKPAQQGPQDAVVFIARPACSDAANGIPLNQELAQFAAPLLYLSLL